MSGIDRTNLRTRRPVELTYRRPVQADRPRLAPALPRQPLQVPVNPPARVSRTEGMSLKHHLKRMFETSGHSWAFHEHSELFERNLHRLPLTWQKHIAAYRRGAWLQRLAFAGLASVIVLSLAIPTLSTYINHQRYTLSDATTKLLGPTNANLVSKITQDGQTGDYYFNKDGITNNDASPATALKSQLGGDSKNDKSLYSVQLPQDPSKGITYYDDNLDLSFSLAPNLKLMAPQKEQGRIVYPAADGVQDVFTTKGNGLKDDIVLTKPGADSEDYSYKLNLPATLQAKMIEGTGEVGIYSADPTLYNNISFGDNASKAAVQKARETGAKNNLVFVLPAPVIKQYDAKTHSAVTASTQADFTLSSDGKTLGVRASGLSKLSYPLTIDPSVVTTSSADFSTGNNEDNNIDYTTANQINRGGLTGGGLNTAAGSWGSTTTLPQAVYSASSVAYNGYIYELGGSTSGASAQNATYYAPLNSNGTIGSWTATTVLPQGTYAATATAYNGYVYVLGGVSGGLAQSTTYYAPLNSDGTIGSWTATTVLPQVLKNATSVVYNGYIYELGGANSGNTPRSTTYYAPLNADGSIGSWTSSTVLSQALASATSVVYNGYIYELGGITTGSVNQSTTYYAPLNADGSIGSWTSSTALPQVLEFAFSVVANGYIYELGGYNGAGQSTTYYAPLNADGSIGSWTSSTALPQVLDKSSTVVNNGYVYVLNGSDSTTTTAVTASYYAKIDPAGANQSFTSGGSVSTARALGSTVVNGGFIYLIGGCSAISSSACSTTNSQVSFASLSATGAIGSWGTTTALPAAVGAGAAVSSGGVIFYIAGHTSSTAVTSNIYYATPSATGAISSWTTVSSPTGLTARWGLTAQAYNGYLYVFGGCSDAASSCSTYLNDVEYTKITTGAPASPCAGTVFCSLTSFTTARYGLASALSGDTVYLSGGSSSGGLQNDIQYVRLSSTGGLQSDAGCGTTWCTSSSNFTTARFGHASGVVNGYLYVGAGFSSTTAQLSDVQYARVATTGALASDSGCGSTWCTGTSLATATGSPGYAATPSGLYIFGGATATTTVTATTFYSLVNNGGNGTIPSWTPGTSLSNGRYVATTVANNGYIYEIGGRDTSNNPVTTVYYAALNKDGSMGSWTTTGALPLARYSASSVVYNGYVYVLAGIDGSSNKQTTVYYAPFNSDGTITAANWHTTGALPQARYSARSIVYNGYVYEIGGGNTTNAIQSTVYYAPFNSDGTITAANWTTTTALPQTLQTFSLVTNNGYVYAIGGDTGAGATAAVYYAQLNSNGTITAWNSTTSLPQLMENGSPIVYNGYIYQVSGNNGSGTNLANVYYAPFNANGSIGIWTSTTALTAARYANGAVVYNGYVYEVGGFNASQQADTYYAQLNSIARIGRYSKLFDLGNAVNTLYGISYNGTLPGGLASVSYRTAGSNASFGSLTSATSLSGTTTVCVATGSTRYVWVSITLDDSGSTWPPAGLFADASNANNSAVTDFTLNYTATLHPPPQNRLRGGKMLQTGTLSALDTCYP